MNVYNRNGDTNTKTLAKTLNMRSSVLADYNASHTTAHGITICARSPHTKLSNVQYIRLGTNENRYINFSFYMGTITTDSCLLFALVSILLQIDTNCLIMLKTILPR